MANIVFGIRPVLEAIDAGGQIEKIYLKKEADGQLISELREICRARRLNIQEVPIEKLNRLTRENHQGVVAQIAAIDYATVEDILASVPEGEAPLVVLFDGITDVRNFGAIARSALCAGAHGIITSLKSSAPVNAEAIKSSAGALTKIPVARVGSIRNTIKMLKLEGLQVVAASEKANKELFYANLKVPTAIVMGSEDKGVSIDSLRLCDLEVAIPMHGPIGSLNVSAAAAVILFEVVRQRSAK